MINLPKKIKVQIMKNKKTGVLVAELPEYDIFTEAESQLEMFVNINDLIYTYFDVPKNLQQKVIYMPEQKNVVEKLPINPVLFKVFTTPEANFSFK